jgi:hypothetical protein
MMLEAEMFTCDRSDRQMKNFNAMTTRLGVDLAELSRESLGYTLVSAIRRCRGCDAGEVCRDWLARAGPQLQKAPAFCPNAELFARARAEQAQTGVRNDVAL